MMCKFGGYTHKWEEPDTGSNSHVVTTSGNLFQQAYSGYQDLMQDAMVADLGIGERTGNNILVSNNGMQYSSLCCQDEEIASGRGNN